MHGINEKWYILELRMRRNYGGNEIALKGVQN